ncbi:MAG: hypothetical protein M1587_11990 [Thaumarchaeota archaeon]|nr:hypothetical protein [Nitrososphaerota archaeon]
MVSTRTLVLIIVVVIALVVGTVASFVIPPMLAASSSASTCTGGVYGARVTLMGADDLGKQLYNLTYTKDNVQQNGLYYSFSSKALNWIKSNTTSSATLLNWWDYGKEIIGCTGRNSVISNPSAQLVALGFAKNNGQLDSNQSLIDVGKALFTTNATQSISIAGKYGATYLFITSEDGGEKAPFVLKLLYPDIASSDYMTPSGQTFNPSDWTSLGQQTVMYRLLDGQSVTGFTQLYSDAYVKIFAVD